MSPLQPPLQTLSDAGAGSPTVLLIVDAGSVTVGEVDGALDMANLSPSLGFNFAEHGRTRCRQRRAVAMAATFFSGCLVLGVNAGCVDIDSAPETADDARIASEGIDTRSIARALTCEGEYRVRTLGELRAALLELRSGLSGAPSLSEYVIDWGLYMRTSRFARLAIDEAQKTARRYAGDTAFISSRQCI